MKMVLLEINLQDSELLIRPIDMHGPDGAMYVIEWGTGFFEDNPMTGSLK